MDTILLHAILILHNSCSSTSIFFKVVGCVPSTYTYSLSEKLQFHSDHGHHTHIYIRTDHLHHMKITHVGTERTRTHEEPREHVTVPQPLCWIKLLFFPLPSLWRGPIPLLFWGRQLVPSGVPCLSPLDVSCSGSLAKENNMRTHTHSHKYLYTHTNKKAQWHLWLANTAGMQLNSYSHGLLLQTQQTGFYQWGRILWNLLKTFCKKLSAHFLNISCQFSHFWWPEWVILM